MVKIALLLASLGAVSPLLPATPKAKRPAPWTRRGAAVDAGDEGIDDAGGASLAELLQRAGATRTEIAAAKKISTENAEVIEYLLDDAGFTTQDVSEMLSLKPALAKTASVAPARETVEFLNATFNLRKCDLRKIFREQPGLLLPSATNNVIRDTGACPAVLATASGGPAARPRQETSTNVYDVVYLLSSVGVKPKNIKEMVVW